MLHVREGAPKLGDAIGMYPGLGSRGGEGLGGRVSAAGTAWGRG